MKKDHHNHNVWKYAKQIGYPSKTVIPQVIIRRARLVERWKMPLETEVAKKHNQAELHGNIIWILAESSLVFSFLGFAV